jgi:hypothetical protein
MNKLTALIGGTGFLIAGCEPSEKAIEPRDTGKVETRQVNLGPEYRKQIWYDLSDNEVAASNPKVKWDLAFHCVDSSRKIFLNTSLAMEAAHTGVKEWDAVEKADPYNFKPDHPSGKGDSLAISQEWKAGDVYLIDRGTGPSGNDRGEVKLQLKRLDEQTYHFRYAFLNSEKSYEATVTKDNRFNHLAYSFEAHEVKQIAPPKDQYDLVFTQYTHVFYQPYRPYSVTGVLLNRHNTRAAVDTTQRFKEMDRQKAQQKALSGHRDVIGYDWKSFSLATRTFSMNPEQVYIIQDQEGFYYKLHFRDFYNEEGQKGYPLFAVKQL